jgi:IclR family acetate operon transcriptional repressor
MKQPRGGIQSLERAAMLLDGVAAGGARGTSLSELSEATGLHPSTAFHLVKTLETIGFVVREQDGKRYRIGPRVFMLAAGALDESMLLTLGTPVLERLSRATGDAAHLAIRSNVDIVVVARTAASGMIQISDRAGAIRPAHATAIGKRLLACADLQDLEPLLASIDFKPFTKNTITSRAALRKELAEIRNTGLAHDRAEFDQDVRCIAAGVTDFAGRCVAAIGLSGPVWRFDEAAVKQRCQTLLAAAEELSTLLGKRDRLGA